jgi:hypothetical protein
VKYQHYQCTYTDLDYLLSNSKQFSICTMKSNLNYLMKIILICSSTVLYMAISSFIISSCVFYLKSQLSDFNKIKTLTKVTIDTNTNASMNLNSLSIVHDEISDKQMNLTLNFNHEQNLLLNDQSINSQEKSSSYLSNSRIYDEKFFCLNKISSHISSLIQLKLFETNSNSEQLNLLKTLNPIRIL